MEMEFRKLGRSGLKVPVLSLGTGTFGGGGEFFRAWDSTEWELMPLALDQGVGAVVWSPQGPVAAAGAKSLAFLWSW